MTDSYKKLYFILFIIYFILLIQVNLRVYSLSSNVADLGFFINNISNVLYKPSIVFTGHVQPLILPIGLLFKIVPISLKSYFLINLQAAVVIITGFLISKKINSYIGLIYAINLPIWVMTLFDFHLDFFLLPLLLYCYLFYDQGKYLRVCILSVLICMIKEPYALVSSSFGVFIIFDQINKKNLNAIYSALFIFLFGISWFFISVFYIMPIFNSGNYGALSGNAYSWIMNLNSSELAQLIKTLNIDDLFKPEQNLLWKLIYVALPFGILGFIPLFQAKYCIPAIPILLIGVLSLNRNYFDYNNHYLASTTIPLLIALHKYFLNNCINNKIKKYVLFCSLSCLIYLGSTPISRLFWLDKVYEFSWRAYVPSKRNLVKAQLLNKNIPKDRDISISSQNNIHTSELSDRKHYFIFPQGVHFEGKLTPTGSVAEYVIVDTKIPLYINADGCSWYFGVCHNLAIKEKYNDYLSKLTYYDLISEYDGFRIYKIK